MYGDIRIIRINHKIAASGFVTRFSKPCLNKIHQFSSDMISLIFVVDPKTSNQNCRIYQVTLFKWDSLSYLLFSRIRQTICEDTCIRNSEGTYDIFTTRFLIKTIAFSE